VPRLFLGNIDQSPYVRRLTGTRFVIDRTSSGIIYTDGETHATGARIEVMVRLRSLRMIIPTASRAVAPVRQSASTRFALQLP
jgi:hypothetical protein